MVSKAIAFTVLGLSATLLTASTPFSAIAAEATVKRAEPQDGRRIISIYAVVIDQLITVDSTFGGTDAEFDTIYVIDGAVEGAADPLRTTADLQPSRAFANRVKKQLRTRLDDLAPLKFVRSRDSVVTGDPPGHVIGNGALLTLGPIDGQANRVEVGASLWINGLAGQWLTYVVERRARLWAVAGTTGPVSLS